MARLGHGAAAASSASQATQRQGILALINMGTPEQAANEIKSLAIGRMANHDYRSAYNMLLQAKNLLPGLQNLEHMLFVSDLLQTVDTSKPGFGVNWLSMLRLPHSPHPSTIRGQFKDFIECLYAIKDEFPETSRAQEILRTAMQDFCKQGKLNQTIFQPVILGLERVNNDGASSKSAESLKRKMPVEDFFDRRVSRNSTTKQPEILGNVGVSKKLASDGMGQALGEHCKSPKKEVCDIVIMNEEESLGTQK